MNKLNSCPVCGGNARLIKYGKWRCVVCNDCQMVATKLCFSEEEVTDEWNSFVKMDEPISKNQS